MAGNRPTGGCQPQRAAKLWARYAGVAEHDTKEVERAIAGHRRVVALQPTSESLRALARLNLERGQSAQAVPWLESLLNTVSGAERLAVVHQLAKAHLSANQSDRAITAIEATINRSRSSPRCWTSESSLSRSDIGGHASVGTLHLFAPVAQWIERRPPKP